MTPSIIETELVSATGFEPTKNYERQDYLAALTREINELSEDDFDDLSSKAQDWFNGAVKALNTKKELPEFPDTEEGDEEPAEEATDDSGDTAEEETAEEEAPPPKTAKAKKKAKPATEVDESDATDDTETDEKPIAKLKTKGVPPRKLAVPPKGPGQDRYGCNKSSKNHQALVMFEKGCRMSDVTESIGGTYYNLLKALVKDGHKLEKNANGGMKLIHKDDVAAPKKVKGKK